MKTFLKITIYISIIFFALPIFGQDQAFKYQAVARDSDGQLIKSQEIGVLINIVDENDEIAYSERHVTSTSDLAIFTLPIGAGEILEGTMENVNYATSKYFLEISIDLQGGQNYELVGSSEILGVPFAHFSTTSKSSDDDGDKDSQNELQQLSIDGNVLTLSEGGSVNIPTGGGTGDGDNDPNNELQQLTREASEITLSLGGGSFTDEVDDEDADPENEIQELSLDGTTLSLTKGGGSVNLPTGGSEDADADPENEIQTLSYTENGDLSLSKGGGTISLNDDNPFNELQSISLSGTTLTLSDNGGSVELPAGGMGDADSDPTNEIQVLTKIEDEITLSNGGGTVIDKFQDDDADPTNEIQMLSIVGGDKIQLSNGGGSVTLEDNSSSNEIQTLSLSGSTLSLSGNGGSVTLPSGGSSPWLENGNEVIYDGEAIVGGSFTAANTRFTLSEDAGGAGLLNLNNGNGGSNIRLGRFSGNHERGAIAIFGNNDSNIWMGSTDNNPWGTILTSGPSGSLNTSLTATSTTYPEYGQVIIYDDNSNPKISLKVVPCADDTDPCPSGVITTDFLSAFSINATVKNFRMPHPENEEKEIWYASLEGPEAGAYERGQIEIINGEAFVEFSEHFKHTINEHTLTISLTPHSPESTGLAAFERTEKGFKIKELFNGKGTYKVDWMATGQRTGFEDYEVVRTKK